MRRLSAVWLASLLILLPSVASGLGLGRIKLKSALNQPLNATIPLMSVKQEDLETLKVKLADPNAFEKVGIERSLLLTQIKFTIQSSGKRNYVVLKTRGAVTEPFLNFLVEVNWARGKMLREYTVLLDPPVVASKYNKVKSVSKPKIRSTTSSKPSAKSSSKRNQSSGGYGKGKVRSLGKSSSGGNARSTSKGYSGSSYRVKRGQTLYSIAKKVRPDKSNSVEQVMMAIYRNNPEAFNKNNINTLKAGKILKLPKKDEVEKLSKRDARSQVRDHAAAWKQGLSAPASGGRSEQIAKSAGTVKNSGKKDKKFRIYATEEDLKGVKSVQESTTAKSSGNKEIDDLRNKIKLLQEKSEADKAEKEKLQGQVNDLEKEMKSLERLLVLKDKELARLQKGSVATEEEKVEVEAVKVDQEGSKEDKPEEASETKKADMAPEKTEPKIEEKQSNKEEPKEKLQEIQMPERPKVASEKSMFDDPKIWAIAAGVVAFILIIIWIILRAIFRRKEDEYDSGERATTVITSVEPESVRDAEIPADEDDFTDDNDLFVDIDSDELGLGGDLENDEPDSDPYAEIDIYLSYSKYESAINVAKGLLDSDPSDQKVRFKLLEIYAQSGESAQFENEAAVFFSNDAGGSEEWEKIKSMGQKLCPDSDLFSDSGSAVAEQAEQVIDDEIDFGDLTDEIEQADDENEMEESFDMELSDDDLSFDLEENDSEVAEAIEEQDGTSISTEEAEEDSNLIDFALDDAEVAADSFDDLTEEIDSLEFDIDDDSNEETVEQPTRTLDLSALEENAASNADSSELDDFEIDLDLTKDEGKLSDDPVLQESVKSEEEFSLDDELDDFDVDFDEGNELFSISDEDDDFEEDMESEDEIGTKLDLAKAYVDMGDSEGAREILQEVINEGNDEQKKQANELLAKIS